MGGERARQTDDGRDIAEQRANRAYWTMLGAFTGSFLIFGIVGYIVSGEVGILVLFVVIAVATLLFTSWGRRRLFHNIKGD